MITFKLVYFKYAMNFAYAKALGVEVGEGGRRRWIPGPKDPVGWRWNTQTTSVWEDKMSAIQRDPQGTQGKKKCFQPGKGNEGGDVSWMRCHLGWALNTGQNRNKCWGCRNGQTSGESGGLTWNIEEGKHREYSEYTGSLVWQSTVIRWDKAATEVSSLGGLKNVNALLRAFAWKAKGSRAEFGMEWWYEHSDVLCRYCGSSFWGRHWRLEGKADDYDS